MAGSGTIRNLSVCTGLSPFSIVCVHVFVVFLCVHVFGVFMCVHVLVVVCMCMFARV